MEGLNIIYEVKELLEKLSDRIDMLEKNDASIDFVISGHKNVGGLINDLKEIKTSNIQLNDKLISLDKRIKELEAMRRSDKRVITIIAAIPGVIVTLIGLYQLLKNVL